MATDHIPTRVLTMGSIWWHIEPMAPDVKIRNLSPDVYQRLQERAAASGRSMEAELRLLVSEAVTAPNEPSTPENIEWEVAGLNEVYEVVAGRIYEAWASGSLCFRVSITHEIKTPFTRSGPIWQCTIDELRTTGIKANRKRPWERLDTPVGRFSRATPEQALSEAIRWLAEYREPQ